MEPVDIPSLLLTGLALAIAYGANKRSDKAIQLAQQSTKVDAVMHFTDRFFELLKAGNIDETEASLHQKILKDSGWAYQFWSLHATEFYFFHHGVLPEFMYSLWMVDLAEMYTSEQGEEIWKSHLKYLGNYSMHYEKMCEFYEQLYGLAKSARSQGEKNKSIADFVHTWREKNPPPQLEQTAFA